DSFGHNAGLPQILSKAGIKYYVFMRPGPHEKDLPAPVFWWESPDGSRVLAHRVREPYCTGPEDIDEHIANSADNRVPGSNVATCFYGVGNHGGGPTIANIRCIKKLQDNPNAPNLVFGTLEDFFKHVLSERVELPVVKGDLQYHAVGCYSAHSGIKALNRRTENALISAEIFCVMAQMAVGRRFPKEEFASAWQRLLLSQFHDILAGTSLEEAYDDVRNWLGSALDVADYRTVVALSAIASKVDTNGEGRPFVVFNPHARAVTWIVRYDDTAGLLVDHSGKPVSSQAAVGVFEHTGVRPARIFVDTVPPLGYKTYYSRESNGSEQAQIQSRKLACTERTLDNERYHLEVDPRSGDIVRIVDRAVSKDLLRCPAGAIVLRDESDTWSHGITAYKDLEGRFSDAEVQLVEEGPVRATIRVRSRFGRSTLWKDISLYTDLPIIEFRVTVDWQEKHRVLKFEFPFAIEEPVVTAEAAYAVVERPADGRESPCQKWVDLTGSLEGKTYGIALINDSKYGYDAEGSTLRLTALRSPIYAFHEPRRVEPGKQYRYMDQGLNEFRFALLPHSGGWQEAEVPFFAALFNMPPTAVETHVHTGQLPAESSLGSISAPNVQLCALKQCEDDEATIVRLWETCGRASDCALRLGSKEYRAHVGPFELKTLKISDGKLEEVDLIERRIERSGN
ncbi:MAG: glycoside hydrolase family 38 C-terminal domain-containing protein, partial [Armatimonadota bacterium]|nr:glycoside hydrolase family 38 C-terminal domain-containing protein [Armatimonadota bacterium]